MKRKGSGVHIIYRDGYKVVGWYSGNCGGTTSTLTYKAKQIAIPTFLSSGGWQHDGIGKASIISLNTKLCYGKLLIITAS